MRKRFMNISKRCMVAILTAIMLMSSVSGAVIFQMGAYASPIITPIPDLTFGETCDVGEDYIMDSNAGTVITNEGTITHNNGTVTTNNGSITHNAYKVTTNNGTVSYNDGIVTDNFGTVTDNQGTVVNNFDGQVEGTGAIANQFYRVEFDLVEEDAQKAGVTFGNDIITKTVGDIDRHYIKEGQSGTITLTPAGDFEINGNTGEELNGTDSETNTVFTYSAGKDANGVWTITIKNMPGSLYLNPENLNLIIQAITGEENPKANIVGGSNDDSGDDDGDQNPPSEETNNNVVTQTNPTLDKINRALAITPNAKELTISFGKQTNLTVEDIKTLCETRPDLAKKCLIASENGDIYELYIPAGVDSLPGYVTALDAMKKDLNGFAGPCMIYSRFWKLGFTCTCLTSLENLATGRRGNQVPQNAVQPQTAAITNSNAVTAAVRNSAIQVSADPHSMGDEAYTSKITSSIAGAPYGGTVKIATSDSAFLNDQIVSSLETRGDVALELSVTINGVPQVISIPAGFNLRALLGADGKIDMQKLIKAFGTPR